MQTRLIRERALRVSVFVLLLLPALWLLWRLFNNQLGANPVEVLADETGVWALRILLLSLLMTPLRFWLSSSLPLKLRRMIGLYAWFYAGLHVLVYLLLEQQLDWRAIGEDLLERPYIMAGMLAFVLLTAFGVTSNRWAVRRLGGQRWQSLHRWVYVAAVAVVAHYFWLAKGEIPDPWFYGVLLLLLFVVRLKRQLAR